jgi:hypothetical protein
MLRTDTWRRHTGKLLTAWCLGAALLAGCMGNIGNKGQSPGSGSGTGGGNGTGGGTGTGGGNGPGAVDPGTVTGSNTPYDAKSAALIARKVKNLLTGLAPTDDDVAQLTKSGAAGLQMLIDSWMTDTATQGFFQDKMLFFFRNTFQQTGFTPTEDFKIQLLQNGGFDFGPLGTAAVGDDAFFRLVQNLQDSFARTAWELVREGHPFTETLTTTRFQMTTGLKSLYLMIEMPNDQPFAFPRPTNAIAWKVDYSGNPIPLEQTLDPSSPNYMVFDDQVPVNNAGRNFGGLTTCHGGTTPDPTTGAPVTTGSYTGYSMMFQRLLGFTPRYPFSGNPTCFEHASKPYFTTMDMSDWGWVDIQPKTASQAYIQPYDIPTLRNTTALPLALPRIGFYTTPAFLALWNTNDSNQHRVTANQTLLVTLGQSFTPEATIIPLSTAGLDPNHAVTGTDCYGCHKSLDPLRQFWANQLDFNDRNDFITRSFTGAMPNPRPTSTGGVLAFGNVNMAGASISDLPGLLMQVNNGADQPIDRFAISITQKLCFFANSTACDETDPEFGRVALAFQSNNYNFALLIKELFSSPLVTGVTATQSFPQDQEPVSILRRDHLCAALSNRLARPDLCAQLVTLPTTAQGATAKIASSIPADAFSRGAESPVTASDPTLFFRSAAEELCENLAPQLVDGTSPVYMSSDVAGSIANMVTTVMGYSAGDPHYADAVSILMDHYNQALPMNKNMGATIALRSTFVLACESPTSISLGL